MHNLDHKNFEQIDFYGFDPKKTIYSDKRLTKIESICLYYVSIGKDVSETAQAMNVKERTIIYYRERIKIKLDCKTIAQAVSHGIRITERV
jgi:DNA-binding CsgD family transcriptional regulator